MNEVIEYLRSPDTTIPANKHSQQQEDRGNVEMDLTTYSGGNN